MDPIKPEDAASLKIAKIPKEVIEAFNELIVQEFDGQCARIDPKDLVGLIIKKGLSEKEIKENHWIDVALKGFYEKAGWKVKSYWAFIDLICPIKNS